MKHYLLFIASIALFLNANSQVNAYKLTNANLPITLNYSFTDKELSDKKQNELDSLINLGDEKQIDKFKKQHFNLTYATYESIERKRLLGVVEKMETAYNALMTKLHDNSEGEISPPLTETQREDIRVQAKEIKQEIKALNVTVDSLYGLYMKDYLSQRKSTIFSFGTYRSRAFFGFMYDIDNNRFRVANNAGFNLSNQSGSLFSELVSGQIGVFRASFGMMISQNNSADSLKSKQNDAYQRLISNGGNTVLKLEYPLAYIHSLNNQYNLISRFTSTLAADLPAFGTNTDSFAANGSVGIEIYGDVATSNGAMRGFLSANINQYFGSRVFQENLGTNNHNFAFGQLSVGIVIKDVLKISAILFTVSSEDSLTNRSVVIGGQVLR